MNQEQIELIQSSWQDVLPIADTAADLFYDRLFELDPALRDLFPEDMTEQKKKLFAMIGRAVSSLNDLDAIVPAIRELGAGHKENGVKPKDYETVGAALLWTLERGLGEGWSDELKDAWAAVYGVLSEVMIAGAEEVKDQEKAKEALVKEAPAKAAKKRPDSVSASKSGSAQSGATGGKANGINAATGQPSGPVRQLVVFALTPESYGLDIGAVREIIRLQSITRVPRSPAFVEGVINLRGRVIPVVNLRSRFGMAAVEHDDESRIVVVDVRGDDIGIIVDSVNEVSSVALSLIEPPSTVTATDDSDYITGIAKMDEALIILLDIERVVTSSHSGEIAAVTEQAKAA